MNNIPEEYIIPKSHKAGALRDFSDYSLFLLDFIDKTGKFKLVKENGSKFYTNQQDFLDTFNKKWNFTFCKGKEMESLFRVLKEEQLSDLWVFGDFYLKDHICFHNIGTAKIRLQKGKSTSSSKYIVNLEPFCKRSTNITNLEELKSLISEFFTLNSYIPLNPTSPGSTSSDLLLSFTEEEFYKYDKIPFEYSRFLHECYTGPRQESLVLGSSDNIQDRDEIKAHLRELGRTPGVSSILKVIKGSKSFIQEAHPGSGYYIEANVPDYYKSFPPLPKKEETGMIYPTGIFRTKVAKPYLDACYERGDIGIKIIDSVQGIMGAPTYPFKELARNLEIIEDFLGDKLKYLELKNFHYTLTGHMIHIHRTYKRNGTRLYEASHDYCPLLPNSVTANIAKRKWVESVTQEVTDIRVDCVSGKYLLGDSNNKISEPGLSTRLTPHLRDKPGTTKYRDLIEKYRDYPGVPFEVVWRKGIREAGFHPTQIGRLKEATQIVPPLGGSRKLDFVPMIGVLLEGELPTYIPRNGDMDLEVRNYGVDFWKLYSILKTQM